MRRRRRRDTLSRQLFDAAYYRRTQANDLGARDDPYDHYVSKGWQQGLDPAPWFSTERYLDDHPDVANAGACPFEHYVEFGREEQRRVQPSAASVRHNKRGRRQRGNRRDPESLAHDLVDVPFYRRTYPDVGEAGANAGDHFLEYGWREGRDPNPWFSCAAYLSANPDVRDDDVNPFLHWLAIGRGERRQHDGVAEQPLPESVKREAVLLAVDEIGGRTSADAHTVDEALEELDPTTIHDVGAIVISVGNYDYRSKTGGIEACVRYEAAKLCAEGINYLYLHPQLHLPRLNDAADTSVRPILNGEPMQPISTDQLAALVTKLRELGAGPADRMVVHGLLGHNPAALREQAQSMGLQIDYWIHDYFIACSSFTLMQNNVVFCAAPPVGSRPCQLCIYGELRPSHVRELHDFFERADVNPLAPSEIAARTWRGATGLSEASVEVIPHGRVQESAHATTPTPMGERPTLAFLGNPALHKGWGVFQRLHPWMVSRQNLHLVHLGSDDQQLVDVEFVEVAEGTRLDMTQALLATGVDAVLIWPLWPETFSLVTYEALAAGLLVVTNPRSGNVGVAAAAANRAIFFDSVRSLERSVISGQLPRLIRQRSGSRPEAGRFEWTGLTPARLGRRVS